jgi:hypothetical protein
MAPPFSTSALDGGEWSASGPGVIIFGGEPRYPLDRRLGGPHSGPGCREVTNLLPLPGIEPCPSRP